MPSLRETLFTVLTGRQGDVSGDPSGDVRGMLLAVGGSSSRTQSGIDLTRAASTLGVSRRTVERWVRAAQTGAGQRPSSGNATALATRARQAATTRAGRRAALAGSAMRQSISSRGARVSIDGIQGPYRAGKDYQRKRLTTLDLDPADAEAMMAAWENGGEKGFMAWASGHWSAEYLPDWQFGSVTNLDVEDLSGGRWR